MRRFSIEREKQDWWIGAAALGALIVVAAFVGGCEVAGSDGKVSTADSVSPVDTQATFAHTGTPVEATPPVRISPVTFDEAESVYREGRFGDAVMLFSSYVTDKPNSAWGHYMLGLSAWKAGDTERAESSLVKALEIDSTHVKSWINLSRVLLGEKRAEEALEKLEHALDLDSTSSEVYRLIGRGLADLGRLGEAISSYREAVLFDDRDVWALNNLGVLFIEEGRSDEALGPLARAVEVRPEVAVFHNNLGMALEMSGYFVAAADQYRLAVESDSTYQKASANLTRIGGREDKSGLPVLDLPALAREFLEGIVGPTRGTPSDTVLISRTVCQL